MERRNMTYPMYAVLDDIRISCNSEKDRDYLIKLTSQWIPVLSPSLKLSIQTFPVVAYGFPTSFDPSCDSQDITSLLDWNINIIPHPFVLQGTEFISRKSYEDFKAQNKKYSSLIFYFTDHEAATDRSAMMGASARQPNSFADHHTAIIAIILAILHTTVAPTVPAVNV
ncbi:hypothetical protein M422DRAFT_39718 [Sphaerobolus stellatus SS14]|uniref:Uncharacterized protein n=1 Tax=Sphaerobolus stellatus (strain SS14) TaxID=990650 RepID=A0A0C9TMY3_SPHS4|nr:hypothetical protein M422DRAFT_39718 [Sphaerobolus stellatus SS14]